MKNFKDKVIVVMGGASGIAHFIPPLLCQVSTAFIEPYSITYPFRKLFQGKKYPVLQFQC